MLRRVSPRDRRTAIETTVSKRQRHHRVTLGAKAVVAATLTLPAAVVSAAGTVQTPEDFYPIGVWSQPIYSFDKWKSRGINTLMKYEPYGGVNSLDEWSAAANARGFYQIRQPRPDPRDDRAESRLLAWMHDDEPDYRNVNASVLADRYARWKAADPEKPILVNFSGGNVLTGKTPQASYLQYLSSTDWVSNDIYPVTGWGRPDWTDYSQRPGDRRTPGMVLDRLRDWSGGKNQWAVLETSNQKLTWISNPRSVTADEFRGQMWHSIIHGAKGIVYFPMQIGSGFRFDTTPTDVVEEMTEQNARIQSLAAVINGSSIRGRERLDLGSPLLEGTTRCRNGDEYYFILNMSSRTLEDQQLHLPGLGELEAVGVVGEDRSIPAAGGLLVDDFAPYALHVYRAGGAVLGDLDHSGTLDSDDYYRIDSGYLGSLNGYHNGDLNLSGRIDAEDYHLLDERFISRAPALSGGALLSGTGTVPEPTSAGLVIAAVLAMGRRRR